MKRFFHDFWAVVRKKNILPKLISFLLAAVLWAYLLSSGKGGELQFRIPVTIENLPVNMAVSGISSRFVTVFINGRPDLLKNVHSSNIEAVLDLGDSKAGSASYPIRLVRNEVPDNVDVSLRQNSVKVFIEARTFKALKVVPVITGAAANGFSVGPIKVKPDTVKIMGAGSILNKFTKIDTLAISIDGAEHDITTDVNLRTEQLDWLELGVNKVQVVIPVARDNAFFKFTIPIEIKNDTKYEAGLVDVKTVTVHIRNNMNTAITDDLNVEAVIRLNPANVEGLMKNKKKAVYDFPVNIVYNKSLYDLEVLFVSPEEAPVSISVKQ